MSWYLMHRGWLSNPAFKTAPLTEREAWLWLIENAAYEDTVACVMGLPAKISRGSLSYSLRFLAAAWKWSKPERVRRYLNHLEMWGMVEVQNVTRQSLITICNYEKYQSPSSDFVSQTRRKARANRDADASGPVTNKKEQNEMNEPKQAIPDVVVWPEWMPMQEFNAYADFRRTIGKPLKTIHAVQLAVRRLTELRNDGHAPADVLNQSIMNGWAGLFPLRATSNTSDTSSASPRSGKKSHGQQMLEATLIGVQRAMNKERNDE